MHADAHAHTPNTPAHTHTHTGHTRGTRGTHAGHTRDTHGTLVKRVIRAFNKNNPNGLKFSECARPTFTSVPCVSRVCPVCVPRVSRVCPEFGPGVRLQKGGWHVNLGVGRQNLSTCSPQGVRVHVSLGVRRQNLWEHAF